MIPVALAVMVISTGAGGVVLFGFEPSNVRNAAVAALFVTYMMSAVYLWRAAEGRP